MALIWDKLIKDYEQEKILWSKSIPKDLFEQAKAWERISTKNNIPVKTAKSIIDALLNKFQKESSNKMTKWQLFNQLQFLKETNDQPEAGKTSQNDEDIYVELLEVKEDESSDEDSSTKENLNSHNSSNNIKIERDTNSCDADDYTEKKNYNMTNTEQNDINISNKRKCPETICNNIGMTSIKKIMTKNDIELKEENSNIKNGLVKTNLDFTNFGGYVANTLKRLPPLFSSKLEIKILQAIIDVNSELNSCTK